MAHKHSKPRPHAEFRHRSQIPMPAVAEVEQQLAALLSPSLLAPRQLERRDPQQPARVIRMRQRLLTLPVMVAILVSLVWRRMPAVAEVHKVLAREGLLWVAPLLVSPRPSPNGSTCCLPQCWGSFSRRSVRACIRKRQLLCHTHGGARCARISH